VLLPLSKADSTALAWPKSQKELREKGTRNLDTGCDFHRRVEMLLAELLLNRVGRIEKHNENVLSNSDSVRRAIFEVIAH
jgi:hypothetical protein